VSLGNLISAQVNLPGVVVRIFIESGKRIRRTASNMQVVPSDHRKMPLANVLEADTIIKRGSELRRLKKRLHALTSKNVTA
jgi:hypothetical protein